MASTPPGSGPAMRTFIRTMSKGKPHHKPHQKSPSPVPPKAPPVAPVPPKPPSTASPPQEHPGTSGSSSLLPVAAGFAAAGGGAYYFLAGDEGGGMFEDLQKMIGLQTPPHENELPPFTPQKKIAGANIFDKSNDEDGPLFPMAAPVPEGADAGAVASSDSPASDAPPVEHSASSPFHKDADGDSSKPLFAASEHPPVAEPAASLPAEPAAPPTPPPEAPAHELHAPPVHPTPTRAAAAGVSTIGAVTESGLVRSAVDRGHGPGEDFNQYAGMHRQAAADAELFHQLLQQRQAEHEEELAQIRGEVEQRDQLVGELEKALAKEAAGGRAAVQQARREGAAETQRRLVMFSAKAAENSVKERAVRARELDTLRNRVNALDGAFTDRCDESKRSHLAHKVATGAFAVQMAAEAGRPFSGELASLADSSDGDPLVAAAAASLGAAAKSGVPTRVQLLRRFEGVAQAARSAGLVKSQGAGPAAHAVAALAARLKFSERSYLGDAEDGGGVEAVVARAEARLASGALAAAAGEMARGFQGTAAQGPVQEWARAARAREATEQAVAMLQAHAASLALSQS